MSSDAYAGIHETIEDTSETTGSSISTLNNGKDLKPQISDNIYSPSTPKDINPESLRLFRKISTETKERNRKIKNSHRLAKNTTA